MRKNETNTTTDMFETAKSHPSLLTSLFISSMSALPSKNKRSSSTTKISLSVLHNRGNEREKRRGRRNWASNYVDGYISALLNIFSGTWTDKSSRMSTCRCAFCDECGQSWEIYRGYGVFDAEIWLPGKQQETYSRSQLPASSPSSKKHSARNTQWNNCHFREALSELDFGAKVLVAEASMQIESSSKLINKSHLIFKRRDIWLIQPL